MSASTHATIIGAGVAGLTCAVELAERGVSVEVLERSDALGAHACSWNAGGMLAPWCERECAEPGIARLGLESIEWWASHFAGTVRRGSLVVAHARDGAELAQFAKKTDHYVVLNGRAIADFEPDLANRFHCGLYFESEAHLDPRAALTSLVQRLECLGVRIRFGVTAMGAHDAVSASARRVVDCRGLAARNVLTDLRGVRGEAILLRQPDVTLRRPVRVLHPRTPIYVVPRGDGVFILGATSIESDNASRITVRSTLELLSAAYALHPAFAEAEILETLVGVRPAFPDNGPAVCERNGVVYVNGLYRHGYLLAPAVSRRVADLLVDGHLDPEVFHETYRKRQRA